MFIAELCQNHQGNPELLLAMSMKAAEAGATHIKIQGIYSEELSFRDEFEAKSAGQVNVGNIGARPYRAEYERLRALQLSPSVEAQFVEYVQELGLTPMITIFSHAGVQRALEAGFKSFKIASYDCSSFSLLRRVAAIATELVISTGATNFQDVMAAKAAVVQANPDIKLTFLHAVTEYPNLPENLRMARMLSLRGLHSRVGYSDHSATIDVEDANFGSNLAIALGATAIERHFTILPKSETRDGKVSVSPEEFASMVSLSQDRQFDTKFLRSAIDKGSLGELTVDFTAPTELELQNARYYRGRFASKTKSGKTIQNWEEWV